jgi:hypothetical protein
MFALRTGGDVLEPTRAAAAMVISPRSELIELLAAAVVVHVSVSFFWAAILAYVLPPRRIILWSTLAAIAIAVFDLRVLGRFFPDILALPFWPQLADHLAWGFTVGAVLDSRLRRRGAVVMRSRP